MWDQIQLVLSGGMRLDKSTHGKRGGFTVARLQGTLEFVALDPGEVEPITRAWEERHIPMELDIVEAPFRELGIPIQEEVRRVTARADSVAAVIIPEIVVSRWWHQFLHGQRALYIKRLLLFEERVILSSVPYQVS